MVNGNEFELRNGHLTLNRPDAAVRLLVFHHAAGSAMSFAPLAQQLQRSCEPVLIELDGRGSRSVTPFATDYRDAVRRMLPVLMTFIDRPTVLLGHSLGALIAHDVAVNLPDEKRHLLRAVVVSSARSPGTTLAAATHPESPFHVRDHESLLEDLRDFDGIPQELLADEDVREHAVSLLGHDLHLADTYVQPAPLPQAVPYHYWYGTGDTTLAPEEAEGWREVAGDVSERAFVGGHFFLTTETAPVAALNDLLEVVAAGAAHHAGSR